MLSGISLVAITLLALMNCASRAMDDSATTVAHQQEEWALGRKTSGRAYDDVTSDVSAVTDISEDDDKDELVFDDVPDVQDIHDAQSKIEVQERDRPRNRKRRDRAMIALLMAYKLKFMALIPSLLGGLLLLKGTTLLAGFFFALFAAVLGLKVH